jgi:hypothetical protein
MLPPSVPQKFRVLQFPVWLIRGRYFSRCTIPTVSRYEKYGVFPIELETVACSGWIQSIVDRGIRDTSRQISFEFLFIKTCPPDKLHKGFGFVIQFRVGIRYVICQGVEFWEKGIQKKFGGKCLLSPGLYGTQFASILSPPKCFNLFLASDCLAKRDSDTHLQWNMGGLLGISCLLLDQTEGFHCPNFLEVGPTVGDDTTASRVGKCGNQSQVINTSYRRTRLAMSANLSVGYTPQTTDIFVCRRHVGNVVPTRRRHSVISANFSAVSIVSVTFIPTHFPTCT